MKEQEIFKQLHHLNKMRPDTVWKNKQREIMLRQIDFSGDGSKEPLFLELFKIPREYLQNFSQPALISFVIAFLILTSSFIGLRVAQNTKPGDSLYLAKIVGEKTQLALAMTDKKKAQLGLDFAVKRVREMKQLTADNGGDKKKDEDVKRLVKDVKQEIRMAKIRIKKIVSAEQNTADKNKKNNIKETNDNSGEASLEDDEIFSAVSGKTDNGLQVSNNNKVGITKQSVPKIKNNIAMVDENRATGTKNKIASTSQALPADELKSPEMILQQASDMLEAESYGDALDVLDDAGKAIDKSFDMGIPENSKGAEENMEVTAKNSNLKLGTSTNNN